MHSVCCHYYCSISHAFKIMITTCHTLQLVRLKFGQIEDLDSLQFTNLTINLKPTSLKTFNMQTIKLNIVSSIVTHNVYYTMHITYNLIGHEDMHNQKLQCTMHCNHLMFMQESNDKIPNENFCWQVFV